MWSVIYKCGKMVKKRFTNRIIMKNKNVMINEYIYFFLLTWYKQRIVKDKKMQILL